MALRKSLRHPPKPWSPFRFIPPCTFADLEQYAATCSSHSSRVISLHPREFSYMKEAVVADKPFLTDIKTLRQRARQHIEQGAVTEGYGADRETVNKLLN